MNLNPGLNLKDKLLTIGEVIEYLRNYFDGVSESKLRFYEKEGLIKPERTKGGHRLYCAKSIKKLRIILELREKYRIPLKDVKKIMERIEKDDFLTLLLNEIANYSDLSLEKIDLKNFKKRLDLGEKDIKKLENMGLIVKCPRTGKYYGESLKIIDILKLLLDSGVTLKEIEKIVAGIKKIAETEFIIMDKIKNKGKNGIKILEIKGKLSEFRDFLYILYLKKCFFEKGSIPGNKKRVKNESKYKKEWTYRYNV